MSDQTSQGVLLTRTFDHMSVISHHDGHLLHHLGFCLLRAAKRRGGTRRRERLEGKKKRSAAEKLGFCLKAEAATCCLQELSWATPTEEEEEEERGKHSTPVCFSFSPLCNARRVWQGRMSLLFLPAQFSSKLLPPFIPLLLLVLQFGAFFLLLLKNNS